MHLAGPCHQKYYDTFHGIADINFISVGVEALSVWNIGECPSYLDRSIGGQLTFSSLTP